MGNENTIYTQLDIISQVLIRCFFMGVGVLFIWWGALGLMPELTYNIHSSMVPISYEQFKVIHYFGMLLIKSIIFLFFLFSYIAIKMVIKKNGV